MCAIYVHFATNTELTLVQNRLVLATCNVLVTYQDSNASIKVRKRLAVSKQAAQRFDRQRFNLRKLNELEVTKQNQIEISNRFAALENLNDDEDVNRTWENIKEPVIF
jgi:hypothetical protein